MELRRQAVKNILQEMSDNAIPYQKVMVQAFQEDWSEERVQKELLKLMTPEALTKDFNYYTDRIMSVFSDNVDTKSDSALNKEER